MGREHKAARYRAAPVLSGYTIDQTKQINRATQPPGVQLAGSEWPLFVRGNIGMINLEAENVF
jgi:hypothetical protein